MDDLILYGKNETEIDGLLSSVELLSEDICMDFGIKKSGVLVLKRGKVAKIVDEAAPKGYKHQVYLYFYQYE